MCQSVKKGMRGGDGNVGGWVCQNVNKRDGYVEDGYARVQIKEGEEGMVMSGDGYARMDEGDGYFRV